MKLGIGTGPQGVDWATLRDVWRRADGLGLDSAWVFDHLLPLSANQADPIYEAWTALAALAAETRSLEVGTLVSANTFRHPALLAKMAATVDHVSGGRLICGLGSGYLESEHEAFGLPYPGAKARAEMLDEACQVLRGLWTEERFTFAGDHYRVTDTPCEPKPVRPGGPPLLVGGRGERRTLRTTARYADQWNMPPGSVGILPEDFAAKLAVLHARCAEIGRDPAEIETNVGLVVLLDRDHARAVSRRSDLAAAFGLDEDGVRRHVLAGDQSAIAEELGRFAAVGVDHFVMVLLAGLNYDDVELFAHEVAPRVR